MSDGYFFILPVEFLKDSSKFVQILILVRFILACSPFHLVFFVRIGNDSCCNWVVDVRLLGLSWVVTIVLWAVQVFVLELSMKWWHGTRNTGNFLVENHSLLYRLSGGRFSEVERRNGSQLEFPTGVKPGVGKTCILILISELVLMGVLLF